MFIIYDYFQWRIQVRGPGAQPPNSLYLDQQRLDQTEARRADKNFLGDCLPHPPPPHPPPYLSVWMTAHPHVTVWIPHWSPYESKENHRPVVISSFFGGLQRKTLGENWLQKCMLGYVVFVIGATAEKIHHSTSFQAQIKSGRGKSGY